MPYESIVVMRPELWYELTNVWPLAYYTSRNVTLPGSYTGQLDMVGMGSLRDQIRDGMSLYLNGRRHDVVLDDGIQEEIREDNDNIILGLNLSIPIFSGGSRLAQVRKASAT